jgi:hypothetical protein
MRGKTKRQMRVEVEEKRTEKTIVSDSNGAGWPAPLGIKNREE